MQVVSLIIALAKLFPIIDSWIDQYVSHKKNEQNKKVNDGIEHAQEAQDQRPIEVAIGSPRAGKPSGNPGSEIVSELPGVK